MSDSELFDALESAGRLYALACSLIPDVSAVSYGEEPDGRWRLKVIRRSGQVRSHVWSQAAEGEQLLAVLTRWGGV